jgi:hypothetical protein
VLDDLGKSNGLLHVVYMRQQAGQLARALRVGAGLRKDAWGENIAAGILAY